MAKKPVPESWVDSIEQFTNMQIASGMLPRTIELRVYQVSRFARAHPDGPQEVRPEQALKYVARQDWSANTRIVVRNSLAAFFDWALEANIVGSDPTASLPVTKAVHNTPRPASRAVIREAIAKAKPQVKLMIRLAADAGLGAMEMATLRHRDVQEVDGDYTVRTQSRAATARLTPLPPALGEDLLALPGDYLFPGQDHGHISPAYISRLVSRVLPAGFTSENLRQAYTAGSGVRLTSWRDASFHSAEQPELLDSPGLADNKALHRHFRRIERFMNSDPATAISECKNVLENLAKQILADLGSLPPGHPSMWKLKEALLSALDLPERSVENDADASLTVAEQIGASFMAVGNIRNSLGTGHGGSSQGVAEGRHARLTFNTTITVAEFLVAAWHESKGAEDRRAARR